MNKEFEEIYEKITNNNSYKVINPFKRLIAFLLLLIVLSFTSIYLFKDRLDNILVIFFILYIVYICYFIKKQNKYIKDYKSKLVKNIVKECNSNFNYEVKYDIGVKNYNNSKLPEKFDFFSSRDGIYGNINESAKLKMAYITTKKKIVEENGTDTVNTFGGIFGMVNVNKYIKTSIEIKTNDIKQNYNKKRIELESAEFEKKFDCFADNKIIALQIITPETIQCITDIYNIFKVPLEINIINNIIYYRVLIKDFFSPPKFGDPMNRDWIENIYNLLNSFDKLMKTISERMLEI